MPTTNTGLKIGAEIDDNAYEKGIKAIDVEMKKLNMEHDASHGEWNYKIMPQEKIVPSR